MALNFIMLPLTADTAKEFPPEKKSYGKFPYFTVTPQSLFGNLNRFYQQK